MYNMMNVDNQAFAIIYSLVIVILGNFFIMNLILAVIFDTFINLQEQERKREQLTKFNHPQIDVSDNSFITEIEDHEVEDAATPDNRVSRFA
jgi:hypothetical protein